MTDLMTRLRHTALLSVLVLVAAAAPTHAQEARGDDFRWSGRAEAGAWITIRNMNGTVSVEGGDVREVTVHATKRWRQGNPERVTIEVERTGPDGRDILVCAEWTDDTVCNEETYNVNHRGSNDTRVDFRVVVPRGVHVSAHSVNGRVDVLGMSGRVRASSVNGAVEAVSTGGPVDARTVNGNVRARMGNIGSDEDLDYRTVNGTIDVEFSGELNADLDVSTLNGGFEANFPITVQGRVNPRRMRATVGRGGRSISLSTVNGRIEMRKL